MVGMDANAWFFVASAAFAQVIQAGKQIGFQFLLPMASHSFRPRRVEDWFDAVPNLLSVDWLQKKGSKWVEDTFPMVNQHHHILER